LRFSEKLSYGYCLFTAYCAFSLIIILCRLLRNLAGGFPSGCAIPLLLSEGFSFATFA
jgi:hypothetical protein